MKVGEVFELPAENKEDLNKLSENINTHESAMNHHAYMRKKASGSLWNTITELLSEDLDSENYIYEYSSDNNTVRCSGVNWK